MKMPVSARTESITSNVRIAVLNKKQRPDNQLEALHNKYNRLKGELDKAGFNAAVFDARITVARRPERVLEFNEQVDALVRLKGGFSPNLQWHLL